MSTNRKMERLAATLDRQILDSTPPAAPSDTLISPIQQSGGDAPVTSIDYDNPVSQANMFSPSPSTSRPETRAVDTPVSFSTDEEWASLFEEDYDWPTEQGEEETPRPTQRSDDKPINSRTIPPTISSPMPLPSSDIIEQREGQDALAELDGKFLSVKLEWASNTDGMSSSESSRHLRVVDWGAAAEYLDGTPGPSSLASRGKKRRMDEDDEINGEIQGGAGVEAMGTPMNSPENV
ncbi:hypothetical protein K402DRAFT_424932 [Aulographum hederae CBS 113979]|uniref:Uncharacterized protein n=1 Tax=Aulographum hederae CBS 113979 TaxID=1176131 RepID=A0A6G1GLW6_9PEZI|nr:hypothetical protein K402DRAFT_424932 [Aulographum hederae CBS 113979]